MTTAWLIYCLAIVALAGLVAFVAASIRTQWHKNRHDIHLTDLIEGRNAISDVIVAEGEEEEPPIPEVPKNPNDQKEQEEPKVVDNTIFT